MAAKTHDLVPHWDVVSPGMFGASIEGPNSDIWFVVVERLPKGGWDWLAWQARREYGCVHGLASSRAAAMRAAELAVRDLLVPAT